jgi:hypothetical protein
MFRLLSTRKVIGRAALISCAAVVFATGAFLTPAVSSTVGSVRFAPGGYQSSVKTQNQRESYLKTQSDREAFLQTQNQREG